VDIAVVETGLGGRLDCTNVLSPEVVIITTLSLDHTKTLGKTLKQIALEKAGVIKKDITTVVGANKKEALGVIRSVCREKRSKFLLVRDCCEWGINEKTVRGSTFYLNSDSRNYSSLKIGLPGEHQVHNAVTAIAALGELRKKRWKITDGSIREGLRKVRWRARFELFKKRPLVILDVAHNPEGIRTLIKALDELIPDKKITFIFGVMADKDYPFMLKQLSKRAELVLLTRPDYHRSASTKELEKVVIRLNQQYQVFEKTKEAYLHALKNSSSSQAICVTGSHFTVGEFLTAIENPRRKLR